jgi:molecular chaperone GrpE (heat shock protein)
LNATKLYSPDSSKEALEAELAEKHSVAQQLQKDLENHRTQTEQTVEQKTDHIRQLLNAIKERDK